MEMLRPVGAHPRAQARRHHDRCEGPGHEGMIMAGAGGFEPPVTGPKPAALPLGYAPPSRAHRTPATGESPPAGSIEQEDCEEEEREQDEHEDRQELHDLPEQRDDQRDELRRGQDPGHLVHRRRAGSAAEQVQGDGHDRRSHDPEPPEAAEDDEQALDEGDQESDPEAALSSSSSTRRERPAGAARSFGGKSAKSRGRRTADSASRKTSRRLSNSWAPFM